MKSMNIQTASGKETYNITYNSKFTLELEPTSMHQEKVAVEIKDDEVKIVTNDINAIFMHKNIALILARHIIDHYNIGTGE